MTSSPTSPRRLEPMTAEVAEIFYISGSDGSGDPGTVRVRISGLAVGYSECHQCGGWGISGVAIDPGLRHVCPLHTHPPGRGGSPGHLETQAGSGLGCIMRPTAIHICASVTGCDDRVFGVIADIKYIIGC